MCICRFSVDGYAGLRHYNTILHEWAKYCSFYRHDCYSNTSIFLQCAIHVQKQHSHMI